MNGKEERTHVFGSPPNGSRDPKSRIHRHHQLDPMDSTPVQEAIFATFFDLGTLVCAYSVNAALKFPGSLVGGGLLRRAFASTVASSTPKDAPEKRRMLDVAAQTQDPLSLLNLPWPA